MDYSVNKKPTAKMKPAGGRERSYLYPKPVQGWKRERCGLHLLWYESIKRGSFCQEVLGKELLVVLGPVHDTAVIVIVKIPEVVN